MAISVAGVQTPPWLSFDGRSCGSHGQQCGDISHSDRARDQTALPGDTRLEPFTGDDAVPALGGFSERIAAGLGRCGADLVPWAGTIPVAWLPAPSAVQRPADQLPPRRLHAGAAKEARRQPRWTVKGAPRRHPCRTGLEALPGGDVRWSGPEPGTQRPTGGAYEQPPAGGGGPRLRERVEPVGVHDHGLLSNDVNGERSCVRRLHPSTGLRVSSVARWSFQTYGR
jgi:hypothetical protein